MNKEEIISWDEIEASMNDAKLQAEHSLENSKPYIDMCKPCPKCSKEAKDLKWLYFSSPEETWEWLCGTAGWMAICLDCKIKVCYFEEILN